MLPPMVPLTPAAVLATLQQAIQAAGQQQQTLSGTFIRLTDPPALFTPTAADLGNLASRPIAYLCRVSSYAPPGCTFQSLLLGQLVRCIGLHRQLLLSAGHALGSGHLPSPHAIYLIHQTANSSVKTCYGVGSTTLQAGTTYTFVAATPDR